MPAENAPMHTSTAMGGDEQIMTSSGRAGQLRQGSPEAGVMSRVVRWVGVVAVAVLALAAGRAGAAVARLDIGSQVGTTQTTATSVSGTKTITTGVPNRLLLVTVFVRKSASDATFSVTTATYGGQNLSTAVITTTSSRDKIYIGYLTESGIVAAGANNTINITISAGTTTEWSVFAQTYRDVSPSAPINASAHNFNETNTTTSASFGTAIPVAAGGYTYYALANNGSNGTRTLPATYVQNWTLVSTNISAFGDDEATATAGTENPTITYTPGQRYVLGAVTLNPAPTNSIQLVTGSNVPGSTAVCPGATVYADQFGFTVVGAADRVSGLTVSGLGATTPIASIKVSNDAGTTLYSAAPTGDTQAFTFTAPDLAAPVGTTNYRLYFDVKSHAALAAGNYTVAPIAASYTSTNPQTAGTDTANSFTIDNTAQANVGASTTNTPTSSSLTLALGASAGLTEYVVWARKGVAPTDNPTDGTQYAVGTPAPVNSWVAYVGTATNPTISGLDPSSTYYFRIFAREACFNYSTTAATASGTTLAPPQTIAVGNGSPLVGAASIAPGSAAWTPVDAFDVTITSGPATNTVNTVTYTSVATMSQYLSSVRVVRVSGGTVLGTQSTRAGDTWTVTINEPISTTTQQYRVEVLPAAHSAMPAVPGSNLVLAPGSAGNGAISAITTSSSATVTNTDGSAADPASGQVLIDNLSPADPNTVVATGSSSAASVSWNNPGDADFQKVVLLAKQGSAFLATERPAEGDDPALNAAYGAATVRYSGATSPQTIGALAAGTWYFKVFSRDTSGNFSAGVGTSAVVTSFVADGDPTPGSVKPVVSIVNPMNGAVLKTPFRLQARIFSPKTSGGVTQPISAVTLLVDGAPSTFTMAQLSAYGTATDSGVWGTTVGATLATGTHTLRVWAENGASGATRVYSSTLTVTVAAGTGDGNLLVRDNANQVCSDCHAIASHSSETTGNKWGSWAVTCRECHTPHGTTNIELVKTAITPPALAGPTSSKPVVFLNKSGYAVGSYASAGNSGPCQVCHTQTTFYRADGSSPGGTHETGPCASCHVHAKGLAASCTACHGTEGRASIAGADQRQAAAPPVVAPGATVFVAGGGAHLAHVNQVTWRANPLPCASCHPAPHATKGATDMAWSAIATGNGAVIPGNMKPPAGALASTWPAAPSCTNWCHGAGFPGGGGTLTAPVWTGNSTSAACGTCHASPPPLGGGASRDHPQNLTCATCHGGDYAQASVGPTSKGTHIDGTVQKPTGCTACHGKLAGTGGTVALSGDPSAAPGYDALSVDTRGSTSRLQTGVGAHIKHVNAGMMSAKTCNVCHGSTPLDGDTSHANGAVAIGWNAPANAQAVAPSWSAGSCTNYCHSSGKPIGGTVTTKSVTWTSTTALGCTDCHASAAIATNAHVKHISTYGVGCQTCHAGTTDNGTSIVAGGGLHVSGSNDVQFTSTDLVWASYVTGGSYDPALYTCASTYCHSNGTTSTAPFGAPVATLAWNGGTDTCSSCHGGYTGTIIPTGTHTSHVSNAAAIGTNYHCDDCHAATVAGGATPTLNYAGGKHVNRVKDVSIANRGTFPSTDTTGTCNATYCHSSGRPATTGSTTASKYSSVTWGQAGTLACNGCHGTYTSADGATYGGWASVYGEPNYASGGPNVVNSNSHRAHVGSAASCAICHQQTTTNGTSINGAFNTHTDGLRQVTWDAKRTTGGAVYSAGTKQCSSVTCHGAGTPVWGGPSMTCTSCHGTTGVETSDLGASFWANDVIATINTNEWSYSGHGKASGTYDVTANPAAAFPTTPTAGLSECIYCHDNSVGHSDPNNPFRLRGVTDANGVSAAYAVTTSDLANAVCLNCHSANANGVDPDGTATGYARKVATYKTAKSHAGAKHTLGSLGGKFCWDCHDPHGDRPNATTNNIAMIGNSVTTVSDGTYGYVGASGAQQAVTFNSEAGSPPAVGKVVEGVNAGTQRVGICQACHAATSDALRAPTAWTKYWNRLGYDDPDGVGGTAPAGSTHNATSTTTPYCISCHTHGTGFGGECIGCHAVTQPITKGPLVGTSPPPRRAVVGEFNNTWSHKRSAIPSGTVTNEDCVVCHMEGDAATATPSAVHADGVINLRDPDTGANIRGVTFTNASGSSPGSFNKDNGIDAVFGRFSRDLTKTLENDPNAATIEAIEINQCLKCHDSNGAAALDGSGHVPASKGGTPEKPFGTTIAGAAYTGVGVTANGVPGGVTDVNASFATTNSSYHPVLGKGNDWYAKDVRMVTPWDLGVTTRSGTVNATSWGPLISCWDCHALPNDTGVITQTVTAHGGTATIRGTATVSGTPSVTNAVTLCVKCHAGYDICTTDMHCAGSAWSTNVNQGFSQYMRWGCNICHSSGYSTAVVRPVRAQDTHGVNVLPTAGVTKAGRWSGVPSGTDARPYAFIRDTERITDHSPKQIGGSTYTPTCRPNTVGGISCQGGTYAVGGTY